jgi:predicted HTH transcriptional regulator
MDKDNSIDNDDLDKALKYIIGDLKSEEFSDLHVRAAQSGVYDEIIRAFASGEKEEMSSAAIAKELNHPIESISSRIGKLVQHDILRRSPRSTYKLRDPLFRIYCKWIYEEAI